MREKLAALARQQWSGWMSHLFGQCTFNEDGTVTIPADRVLRWLRQIVTPYNDLSENEKDADRCEADKVMGLITVNLPMIIMEVLET